MIVPLCWALASRGGCHTYGDPGQVGVADCQLSNKPVGQLRATLRRTLTRSGGFERDSPPSLSGNSARGSAERRST